AACDGAVLDFGPIIIGHELAAAYLAKYLAFVGQSDRRLGEAFYEQIGGTAVDRNVIDIGLGSRSVDNRLIITRDETRILAKARDAQGHEVLFEKRPRLGFIRKIESSRNSAR